MLAALGMRCAALAPRLRAARRLATPARLAPSPLDEDFLLPDRGGDGFGERPPPRRRETQKLCYKCGEPGHLARDCPSDGGSHREPRGPAPPHALPRSVQRPPRGFGPTALSEAVSRRLDEPSMRLLAQLETADADAIAQRLEEAGGTVRNPSGYVMKAVERVRRGGTAGWNGAVGRCATCGAQGHLARDCPSAARGAPLDSLASLPPPPSARGNVAPRPDYPRPDQRRGLGTEANSNTAMRRGDWICGVCTNHNFASRNECNRCGTPKPGEPTNGRVGGFQVPRPTRSRSRSRERRRRRGHRS